MGMMRGFVVIVYMVAFFVALWQISTVWSLIELAGAYAESTVIFSLLVALCGVLISSFVYIDGEEIDRLKEFTGLAKYEEEEIAGELLEEEPRTTLEEYMKQESKTGIKGEKSKAKELVSCRTCAFFGKPVLCQLGEKNPNAIACVYYRKKS
jgi:hypothetical protein